MLAGLHFGLYLPRLAILVDIAVDRAETYLHPPRNPPPLNAVFPLGDDPFSQIDGIAFHFFATFLRLLTGLHNISTYLKTPVADLLLASEDRASVGIETAIARLTLDRLMRLIERGHIRASGYGFTQWFRKLAPAHRETLFATYGLAWRDQEGYWPLPW